MTKSFRRKPLPGAGRVQDTVAWSACEMSFRVLLAGPCARKSVSRQDWQANRSTAQSSADAAAASDRSFHVQLAARQPQLKWSNEMKYCCRRFAACEHSSLAVMPSC